MATRKRTASRKPATKRRMPAKRKTASKRELIDSGTNKLFVRRNPRGSSFAKVVNAGRMITPTSVPRPSARSPRARATAAIGGNRNSSRPTSVGVGESNPHLTLSRLETRRITPRGGFPLAEDEARHDHWHGGRDYRLPSADAERIR
jgi:hypothetical protein